jgi:hypothetical protein
MGVIRLPLPEIERFNSMADSVLLMSVTRSCFYAALYGVNTSLVMRHIITRI